MVPLVTLARQPFMEQTSFVIADTTPFPKKKERYSFWKQQLVTLGMKPDRIKVEAVTSENSVKKFLADTVPRNAGDRLWIITRSGDRARRIQQGLETAGYTALAFGNSISFLSKAFIGSASDAKNGADRFRKTLECLGNLLPTDVRYAYSAAQAADRLGFDDLGGDLLSRSVSLMEEMIVWDFPRTGGWMTSAVCQYLLNRGDIDEAASWFCRAFGKRESRHHDYVRFLDTIPDETVEKIYRRGVFSPRSFSTGLIFSFENNPSLDSEYKAYWAYKGAQLIERHGGIRRAVGLYLYSASMGDSLGRASLRLYDYYSRKGDLGRIGVGYYRAIDAGSRQPDLYIGMFARTAEKSWPALLSGEAFHPEAYTDGLLKSLAEDRTPDFRYKLRWLRRIGGILKANGFETSSKALFEFAKTYSPPQDRP